MSGAGIQTDLNSRVTFFKNNPWVTLRCIPQYNVKLEAEVKVKRAEVRVHVLITEMPLQAALRTRSA